MSKRILLVVAVFASTILCTTFLSSPFFYVHSQPFISVSKDFTAAFDAAVQELITDSAWVSYYSENMFFGVPTCSLTKPTWPVKDPFASRTNSSRIVTCFEIGTLSPWLETKTKLANNIVDKINAHYKTNYINEIKRYNTSLLGFFDTMKNALATGDCDIVTANTRPSTERAKVVHFQCDFGFASNGWIRSAKDPQLVMKDVYDLNKTGILVGAYDGTNFATFVKTQLSAATYVPFFAVNLQYGAVLNQTVHALIGDAIQFNYWKKQNQDCGCTVQAYDVSFGLATFTYGNITETSVALGIRHFQSHWIMMVMVSSVWMVMNVWL
ncbi:hypothetical protein C9374_001863 [Naegleria lovaniensis]|uniref:Solute-binding protein family 3/N-terminal domain-containing protein n=1 Tax=Naegleria lovaniensis TaxID=51637 RepID=A0AA88KLN0_NAELO|nr:uncharacterized protein C9374_001863 [Naegleria lovaniensis]KAG2386828.1 hypothetical protein C9374_001863 [Naegleria lovaniensis]